MKVTILGSGTIIPSVERSCSSYLLRSGALTLLLDCGPGTLRRLGEFGIAPTEIDAIVLSHFHLDHVADLFPILMARWLGESASEHEIALIGPVGLRRYIDLWMSIDAELRELTEPWLAAYRFDTREFGGIDLPWGGETQLDTVRLKAGVTPHTASSVCYRIADESGKVLFYSGDTDYTEEILPLAQDADLAIMECSLPESAKVDGHLTPALAGRLAEKSAVRQLVLTHFYSAVFEENLSKLVSNAYSGKVNLARDGETIAIG